MALKAEIVISAVDQTGAAFTNAQKGLDALGQGAQASAAAATKAAEASAAAAAKAAKTSATAIGSTFQATGIQHQIAAVQVKDFLEQVISGGSPIRAFAQQGAAVVSTYGGFGNTVKALTGLLSPMVVGIGAAAVAVGFLGAAFIAGAKETKAFNDAIKLTGNFAGQTIGQFDDAAKQISASSQTTSAAAKEFGRALIATGQVGPQNFRVATEAAVRYGEATGKTADAVAADFASMGTDVAKWAADHNRSLHFITTAQYEQIKALQDSGREVQAEGIVYDALNQHLHALDTNLGTIDRALAGAAKGWDAFWTAAKGIGKADTTQQQLAEVERRVRVINSTLREPLPTDSTAQRTALGVSKSSLKSLQGQDTELQRRQFRESENATAQAFHDLTQAEGIEASTFLRALDDKAKGITALDRALDDLHKKQAKAELATGIPVSDERKKLEESEVRKEFADTGDGARAKTFEGYLKDLQQDLEKEHDLVSFAQGRLDELYQHGDLSIAQYYDSKKALAADDLKTTLATYDKEIAGLRERQRAIGTGSQASMTRDAISTAKQDDENKINDLIAARAKAIREAGQAAVVAGFQETRAVENLLKALNEFDAGLADLRGDKATADALRNTQRLIDAQRQLHLDPAQAAEYKNLLQAQSAFNQEQEHAAQQTEQAQAAETLFAIQAKRDGLDRETTEKGLLALHEKDIAAQDEQIKQVSDQIALQALLNNGIVDPKLIAFYDRLKIAREQAFDAKDPGLLRFNQLAESAGNSIAQSFEDAAIQGGKLSDVIKKLGLDLGRLVFHDLVTQPLADSITQGIKGIGKAVSPSAADAGALVGPLAPAVDGATVALGGFTQALASASGAVGAAPGAIPAALPTIGEPGPVLPPSSALSPAAVDAAAADTTDKAITGLADSAAQGAKGLQVSTGQLVQGVSVVTSSLGGLPAAFGQLLSSLFALVGSSSTGVVSGIAGLFTGSSTGSSAGGFGGGGTSLQAAAGGPAPAGALIQVNEKGPELLSINGQHFLMMGQQPGMITPNDRVGPALAGSDRVHILQSHEPGTPGAALDAIDGAEFRRFMAHLLGGPDAPGISVPLDPPPLGHNEVAAVLMGGPRGTREEVLSADDPRHRDNLPRYHSGGIVGESANAEAFASAWRQRDGGGNVYITNNTPATVSASRDDNGDWRVMIDAAAKQAHQMVAADHASGSGPSSAALRKRGVNLDGSNPRRQ